MDAIRWLWSLQHLGVKLGLANVRRLLELLGHPQRAYPAILIGGTNGKGSVAAMVHALLLAAGRRAGLYTSPHLVRASERIRIGRADVPGPELERRLAALRRVIEEGLGTGRLAAHPSFFEVVTATALQAFRDHGLDAAVLEVGLGGRLDATNAVEPEASVIVGVGLDHERLLGSTVEEIAREKAGILRPGRPLVSGATPQGAVSVLIDACRRHGARFVDARTAVRLTAERGPRFDLATSAGTYRDLSLPLGGRHQIDNARIALAAFEAFAARIGLAPEPEQVRQGLAAVRWPGRLQWVSDGRGPGLLLDGAHNADGAAALAGYLAGLGGAKSVAVFGAMRDKAVQVMIERLAPFLEALIVTRPGVERSADPAALASVARTCVPRVEIEPEPARALARARELAGGARPVLVTGSLYLVGEILATLENHAGPGPVAM